MDKKRIIKIVLAVGFVLVCGAVYLVYRNPFGNSEGIVFEKQSDISLPETEDVSEAVGRQEHSDAGEQKDDGENQSESAIKETMLYVHICGAVSEEGVYALPAGSRVTDGIKAAGGFRDGADATFHNLAALLTDGQKIYVPTLEETESLSLPERAEGSLPGTSGNGAGKKVNLNTADLAELMTLSGIGEAKAESILKYREKVGRFQNIEELKKVSGIGEAMFERIRDDIVTE